MTWKRRIAIMVGAVALGLVILYGFWPEAQPVDTAEVIRGPLEVVVQEEARTRVVDRYAITAPVAGYAPRVDWDAGDHVGVGDVLVALKPLHPDFLDPRRHAEAEARVRAAEAALHSAEQNVEAARADAAYAQADFDRVAALWDKEAATKQELDRARTQAARAQAQLTASERAVDVARYEEVAARTALSYSAGTAARAAYSEVPVASPVEGEVLNVYHRSEGVVGAGETLMDVGSTQALEIVAEVLSADAVRIEPGTPVRFERWGGSQVLDGRVRVVEPHGFTKVSALGVEEQRVYIVADITSPRKVWARLGDGYRVVAQFIVWTADDVLHVPTSALFRFDGGQAVFVVESGRAQVRPVQVGQRAGLATQITGGLEEGETVIVHPDSDIEEGTRVAPRYAP